MTANTFRTRAALLLVSSLTVMAGAIIAPALPALQAHFAEAASAGLWVRLVLTVPALLIVLSAPLAGLVADRWGRRPLLVPALILYGIAGSSGLYLDALGAILAGRALLGVAVAGIMTGATTLIADYYEGSARAQFMGWQAAFMSLGGVGFLTGGGLLAEWGWRWPFAVYLVAFLLVPLALVALPEPVRPAARERTGEAVGGAGVRPTRLLGFLYGTALSGMILFYFIPLQIPFYLEALVGAGPTASGMAIAVATLFGTATSLAYRRIRTRIGYLPILALSFGLMGVGYLLIGLADGYLSVLAGLAVGGLGMGLMFPNLNVWLAAEVPAAVRGRAVGGLTTAIFLRRRLGAAAFLGFRTGCATARSVFDEYALSIPVMPYGRRNGHYFYSKQMG